MNILQIVQHLKTGGLETMVLDLMKNSQYCDTTYIVALEGTKEDALAAFPQLQRIEHRIICLNKAPGWKLGVVEQLTTIIKEKHIDALHSHHIGPLIYGAMAQKQCKGVGHIHTIHDAWFLNTRRYRFMFQFIAKMTNVTLVADAKTVANDIKDLAGINVDETILNGIDITRYSSGDKMRARQSLGLPLSEYLIGCAARLAPGKGHKALIETLAKLPESVHLVLAGQGELGESLEALSQQLKIAHRIHWLGQCQDMPSFYQAIDSFCLFSEREGLPLSVMEAIASYKPVVSTNVGGIPEVVTSDVGMTLEPTNTRSLHSALLESLRTPVDRTKVKALRKRIDVRTMSARYDALVKPMSFQ